MKHSLLLVLLIAISCKNEPKKQAIQENANPISENVTTEKSVTVEVKKPEDFVPKGFVIFDKIIGDLNNDGADDCVLIIKGTQKDKFIVDEDRGELDQNRRGIIVLLKDGESYRLASQNLKCFSSENEDGGVYYAPELNYEIDLGKLYIIYAHGRYGYWRYTFRYQNDDFELIGYQSASMRGPVIMTEISINFSTKRKQVKENTNEEAESGDEVFYTETWTTLKNKKMIKLSEIKDFDELYEFN